MGTHARPGSLQSSFDAERAKDSQHAVLEAISLHARLWIRRYAVKATPELILLDEVLAVFGGVNIAFSSRSIDQWATLAEESRAALKKGTCPPVVDEIEQDCSDVDSEAKP